jgi:hypothetical protein
MEQTGNDEPGKARYAHLLLSERQSQLGPVKCGGLGQGAASRTRRVPVTLHRNLVIHVLIKCVFRYYFSIAKKFFAPSHFYIDFKPAILVFVEQPL